MWGHDLAVLELGVQDVFPGFEFIGAANPSPRALTCGHAMGAPQLQHKCSIFQGECLCTHLYPASLLTIK